MSTIIGSISKYFHKTSPEEHDEEQEGEEVDETQLLQTQLPPLPQQLLLQEEEEGQSEEDEREEGEQKQPESISSPLNARVRLAFPPLDDAEVLEQRQKRSSGGTANSRRKPPRHSLSQLYTHLPPALPTVQDLHRDCIEWLCHVCLLRKSGRGVAGGGINSDDIQRWLERDFVVGVGDDGAQQEGDFAASSSRVSVRLLLTSVWIDAAHVVARSVEQATAPVLPPGEVAYGGDAQVASLEATTNPTLQPPQLEPENWKLLADNLDGLRQKIIEYERKKNANEEKGRTIEEGKDGESNDGGGKPPALPLQRHDVMTYDYSELRKLIRVQYHLAVLRQELQDSTSDKAKALEGYKKNLQETFGDETVPHVLELRAPTSDGASLPFTRMARNPSISSAAGPLTARSAAATRRTSRSSQMLAETLQHQIDDIVLGGDGGADDDRAADEAQHDGAAAAKNPVYSLGHFLEETRSYLLKLSEKVLEIPTLFQCGYGGVRAPVASLNSSTRMTNLQVEDVHHGDISSVGGEDDEDDDGEPLSTQQFQPLLAQHDPAAAAPAAPGLDGIHHQSSHQSPTDEEEAGLIERPVRRPKRKRPRREKSPMSLPSDNEELGDVEPLPLDSSALAGGSAQRLDSAYDGSRRHENRDQHHRRRASSSSGRKRQRSVLAEAVRRPLSGGEVESEKENGTKKRRERGSNESYHLEQEEDSVDDEPLQLNGDDPSDEGDYRDDTYREEPVQMLAEKDEGDDDYVGDKTLPPRRRAPLRKAKKRRQKGNAAGRADSEASESEGSMNDSRGRQQKRAIRNGDKTSSLKSSLFGRQSRSTASATSRKRNVQRGRRYRSQSPASSESVNSGDDDDNGHVHVNNRPFSKKEIDALIRGIEQYGLDSWKTILKSNRVFWKNKRSWRDLKDQFKKLKRERRV